jgi:putative phosphoesterase
MSAVKIGVLSDTHLQVPDRGLDFILDNLFAGTDLILHAGDVVSFRVLERLQERGAIVVCGNMDDWQILDAVPQIRVIEAEEKRIGLIHGWGAREGLERRVIARFPDPKPDLIVYGHSHIPFWGKKDGALLFNPGSANSGRYSGATVGLVEIVGDRIDGRILSVEQ